MLKTVTICNNQKGHCHFCFVRTIINFQFLHVNNYNSIALIKAMFLFIKSGQYVLSQSTSHIYASLPLSLF